MSWAPGLVRYAARFTRSIDDAEDAYQRAMEIALTRAPVTESQEFIPWLHTVIRREAALIAQSRAREVPLDDEELETTVDAQGDVVAQPDAVFEWRERYRAVQDALAGLTDSQRVCLMLRSAGASHDEIRGITGFSERKVHRSIMEGRARLHAWEIRMAAGDECEKIAPLIDRTVDESANGRDRRALARHIRHCPSCRSRYRSRREQVQLLGSLVPTILLGSQILHERPPDPTFAVSWWERITGSANMRAAQVVQLMNDLPALASTKAGAGAIAAAAAGVVGAPMVIDAVRADRAAERPSLVRSASAASPDTPSTTAVATPPRTAAPARRPSPARRVAPKHTSAKQSASSGRATVRVAPRMSAPATYTYRKAPARSASRPRTRPSSPALEFGP
jgi:RNA polymerase sigma factor (sigma-70 family)